MVDDPRLAGNPDWKQIDFDPEKFEIKKVASIKETDDKGSKEMKEIRKSIKDIIHSIGVERVRQIIKEGYQTSHDDSHNDGSMAMAAACYAASSAGIRELWPWHPKFDKRKKHDRKKKLIIAGALIVAELQRLNRKEKS